MLFWIGVRSTVSTLGVLICAKNVNSLLLVCRRESKKVDFYMVYFFGHQKKVYFFGCPTESLLFWTLTKVYFFGLKIMKFSHHQKSLLFWTLSFFVKNKKSTFLAITFPFVDCSGPGGPPQQLLTTSFPLKLKTRLISILFIVKIWSFFQIIDSFYLFTVFPKLKDIPSIVTIVEQKMSRPWQTTGFSKANGTKSVIHIFLLIHIYHE